jgi:hypothetical protein
VRHPPNQCYRLRPNTANRPYYSPCHPYYSPCHPYYSPCHPYYSPNTAHPYYSPNTANRPYFVGCCRNVSNAQIKTIGRTIRRKQSIIRKIGRIIRINTAYLFEGRYLSRNPTILPQNRPQVFKFVNSTCSIRSCSEFGWS